MEFNSGFKGLNSATHFLIVENKGEESPQTFMNFE